MMRLITLVSLLLALFAAPAAAQPTTKVTLVAETPLGPPAQQGLDALAAALERRGVVVQRAPSAAAATGGFLVTAGVAADPAKGLTGAEALVVTPLKGERPGWRAQGSDDRGLMYALLDMADRVGWAKDPQRPLSEVRATAERPYTPERGLSIYTMQKAAFEQRFFDDAYWARYFDVLARNRFNTFVLIFGYENGGYFAPAYPYFFDVEGFPEVRVTDLTAERQARNLTQLNKLVAMAKARGVDVTLGLWDHIYRGGVQAGGGKDAPTELRPDTVSGIGKANLMGYHKAALDKLLTVVPGLHAVQFRTHAESGLSAKEMPVFWSGIYDVMLAHPEVIFDARIKDFPDSLIELAASRGVNIRLNTKYWAEHMGLPFHPTHVQKENQHDRRHGYADLLRRPQRFRFQWQLWNGGTTRMLLWGSPEYARRFAESTRIYEGSGLEVNEMLSTKMASQPHDKPPYDLLGPDRRYYDYEFERYWHFYQAFGRMAYNPQTPPEVWTREFERRFAAAARPVEAALHRASWVLPMIEAYNMPMMRFPTTFAWVEKQRREDLPLYARSEPSDTEQFQGFRAAAADLVAGRPSAKRHPLETSRWFDRRAAEVRALVRQAEVKAGAQPGREFASTMVDLKMLADLAEYHARRIEAGFAYALFQATQDVSFLDQAIAHERRAIEAWAGLVRDAGDVYPPDLQMGRPQAELTGHWRDELVALRAGLSKLEEARSGFQPDPARPVVDARPLAPRLAELRRERPAPSVTHARPSSVGNGEALRVRATVQGPAGVAAVRLRYRPVNQYEDFRTLEMVPTGRPGEYGATIPAAEINPGFDLMYFIEAIGADGAGGIYPDLERETPYIVVRVGAAG
jgi:hypothetical protein